MLKLITVLLFLPTLLFSQGKIRKIYLNPNIVVMKNFSTNSIKFGGSINGGVRIKSFYGLGLGAEYYKVLDNFKSAIPLFLDLRYFFPKVRVVNGKKQEEFFVAFNIGKIFFNVNQRTGSLTDYYVTSYDGKSFFNVEGGMILSKMKQSGFLIGLAYKNYGIWKQMNHYNSGVSSTSTVNRYGAVSVKIGYKFQ